MDIKLISIVPVDPLVVVHRKFSITVNGVEISGTAYNRFAGTKGYRLFLVFSNKEVRKHPKYEEIRIKTIQLLLRETANTLFSLNVTEPKCQ